MHVGLYVTENTSSYDQLNAIKPLMVRGWGRGGGVEGGDVKAINLSCIEY